MKLSRSHIQTDLHCERETWLRYYYGGTGLTGKGVNLDIEVGNAVHLGIGAALSHTSPHVEQGVEQALAYFEGMLKQHEVEADTRPHCALIEGLVRVWMKVRYPQFEGARLVGVEREFEESLSADVVLMLRPDLLIADAHLVYPIEFKTQSYVTDNSIEAWHYDLQISALVLAARQVRPHSDTVFLEVLNKGTKRMLKNGLKFYSPLVTTPSGPSWEVLGGVKAVVEAMPPEVLTTIVVAREISRSEQQLEAWLHTVRETGEKLVRQLEGQDLNELFPKQFRARLDKDCFSNKYSKPCAFLKLCYGEISQANLWDFYQAREPHHKGEFEA